MPQSLSDTINLIASLASLIGGVIAIGGAMYTWWAITPAAKSTHRLPQQAIAKTMRLSASLPRPRASSPPAKAPARGASHPIILGFSAVDLLAVIIYSLELLTNYAQSGGATTMLPSSSPLIGVNAALFVVNLACMTAVTTSLAVTAYRARSWGWASAGVIALAVSLFTVGVFSVVAVVPGVFYGLSGPRDQDGWRS